MKCNLDYKTEAGDTWHFELVDTAGRRASTKHDVLDYFSELRSDDALGRADVVVLVLSAEEGVTRMDKQLAGKVAESGAGLIIVVNKWDLVHQQFRAGELVEGYTDESEFRRKYKATLRSELFFLPDSPVLFTSAKTDFRTENILAEAREIHRRMYQKISTASSTRPSKSSSKRTLRASSRAAGSALLRHADAHAPAHHPPLLQQLRPPRRPVRALPRRRSARILRPCRRAHQASPHRQAQGRRS